MLVWFGFGWAWLLVVVAWFGCFVAVVELRSLHCLRWVLGGSAFLLVGLRGARFLFLLVGAGACCLMVVS